MSKEGVAEPRLLRLLPNGVDVRHYGCRACESGREASEGCGRAVGFYAHAFTRVHGRSAAVRETACHRRADPTCEFEVRW